MDDARPVIAVGNLRVYTGRSLQNDWSTCNQCGASLPTQQQFLIETFEASTRLCRVCFRALANAILDQLDGPYHVPDSTIVAGAIARAIPKDPLERRSICPDCGDVTICDPLAHRWRCQNMSCRWASPTTGGTES